MKSDKELRAEVEKLLSGLNDRKDIIILRTREEQILREITVITHQQDVVKFLMDVIENKTNIINSLRKNQ